MTSSTTDSLMSRRSALAGLGAGGLGLTLANAARPANAQDASPGFANHPIVGVWRAITPGGPSLVIFHPDGSAVFIIPATFADPQLGVVSQTTEVAVWEPTGEAQHPLHLELVALGCDWDLPRFQYRRGLPKRERGWADTARRSVTGEDHEPRCGRCHR